MKVRVIHLIYGLVGVTALVGGLWLWHLQGERRDEQELDEGLAELGQEARGRERDRPVFLRQVGRHAGTREEVARENVFMPPPGGDPGELDAQEAIDAFTGVMDELEQIVEDERELDDQESAEYYNRATGSFKAMSAWIDGSDPRERALLDDAHKQMLDLMRRLDIRPPARELDGFVTARER
jgi:hypothetical protein